MGNSRRFAALVYRSLGWASSIMAVAATTLVGKVETAQAAEDFQLASTEADKKIVDQVVGYIQIGDFSSGDDWPIGEP